MIIVQNHTFVESAGPNIGQIHVGREPEDREGRAASNKNSPAQED